MRRGTTVGVEVRGGNWRVIPSCKGGQGMKGATTQQNLEGVLP